MSPTALKKAKRFSKSKTKQSLTEPDAMPTSLSKGPKPKLTKSEEHAHKTKSKLVKGEETKQAERPQVTTAKETRRNTVANTPNRAKRATRLERKPPGPWRAPSPSPSLSPMSDFEPSHSEEDEPEESQEEDGPGEENVHLYGFSTDEDSSDDDLDVDEEAGLDVGSLPTVARDDAAVKSRLERAKRKPVHISFSPSPLRVANKTHYDRSPQVSETGVVYLSRIPHGFYEDQMRAYFSQFGEISRLRLSRNKRVRLLFAHRIFSLPSRVLK